MSYTQAAVPPRGGRHAAAAPRASRRTHAARVAWAALLGLALIATGADAQCYLEDANAECTVCWFTTYSAPDDKTGTTKMSACPADIKVEWVTPLPEEMTEYKDYLAEYKITVADQNKYKIVAKQDKKSGEMNHVPHANIHSCIASRGACTPFVGNTPGLSTHTPAVVGAIAADGTSEIFKSDVQLTREQYTIIAHVRFFTPNEDPTLPDTKIDAAVGVSREVLQEVAEVSADSYISTGIMGAILLIVIAGIWYGVRNGKIDIDAIVEAVYSDEVTLPLDVLTGVGDVSAFTVSVFTIILYDPNTVQVVPAAILFLVFAWVGSLYNAYNDIRQMWSIHLLKSHRQKFMEVLTKKMVTQTVRQARRLSTEIQQYEEPNGIQRRVSIAGQIVDDDKSNTMLAEHLKQHIKAEAQEEHKFNVMLDLEVANREIRRKRGDLLTVVTESIPITCIQTYVLLNAEEVQAITVITLIFAVLVLGAKLAGLGSYKTARIKREQAEERFHDHFDVVMPESPKMRSPKLSAADMEKGNRVVPIVAPNVVQIGKSDSGGSSNGSTGRAAPGGPAGTPSLNNNATYNRQLNASPLQSPMQYPPNAEPPSAVPLTQPIAGDASLPLE